MSKESYTCPYCKQEIPSKDFAVKDADGGYWHMPCADRVLDEWVRLQEVERLLIAAYEANQIHVSQGGHVGELAKLVMEGLEGKA